MIRDIVRSICELVILNVYNVNIKYKLKNNHCKTSLERAKMD